jgi:hypothetical protein
MNEWDAPESKRTKAGKERTRITPKNELRGEGEHEVSKA